MIEILIALVLMFGIFTVGVRRIRMIKLGYILQSLCIAFISIYLGIKSGDFHYFIVGALTIVAKLILIPYVIDRASARSKQNREMQPIITGFWSYIFAGISIAICFGILRDLGNDILKAAIVLMIIGAMIIVGRKNTITQMIGFLTMENGFVLIQLALVKMSLLIEVGIMLEVLILSGIMSIMTIYISREFDSQNTDHLTNLKE